MAAKKKAAAPKKKSTALTTRAAAQQALALTEAEVLAQMQADAGGMSVGLQGEGNFISTKGKKFNYQGNDLGTEMDVCIIDYSIVHTYYDSPYDEDDTNAPACAMISYRANDDFTPLTDAPKPQASVCQECELNEFGSDSRGKGKACTQVRLLAMIAQFAVDDIPTTDVVFMKTSPTANKSFDGLVTKCDRVLHGRPIYSFVVRLGFDPDVDFPRVTFELLEPIEDMQALGAIIQKRKEVADQLLLPWWDFANYHEPVAKGRGAASKKKRAFNR